MSTPPLLFLPFYLPLRVAAASTTAKRGLFLTDSLTDRRLFLSSPRPPVHVCKRLGREGGRKEFAIKYPINIIAMCVALSSIM